MATQIQQPANLQPEIDETKVHAFLEKAVNDFGGAISAGLVVIGDKLGLYKAMAGAGPLNSDALARRSGCTARPMWSR